MATSQEWNAAGYARNARFVSTYGRSIAAMLAPQAHERILDVGCGDGELTAEVSALAASIVGVDGSPEFVAAARARGLDARLIDARALPFEHEFDAVFSNAALHWMSPLEDVVAGVRRALLPRGRFVGEMGGHGNVAAVVTAIVAALAERGIDGASRMPWTFPTSQEFAAILERHDFAVETVQLIARPTPLPTGIEGWLGTFAGPFLQGLGDDERRAVIARVATFLAPSLRDRSGRWIADYVRLRFTALVSDAGHA